MPVRYIGREPIQKGKTLYEICRQLVNAEGRVVYRQKHAEYWPEQKSYYRLTKVVPDKTSSDFRKGDAWGHKVFRGATFGECRIGSGHKQDWRLVPKAQEEEFCRITDVWPQPEQPPTHISCPPWLEVLLKQREPTVAGPDGKVTIPLEKLRPVLKRTHPDTES